MWLLLFVFITQSNPAVDVFNLVEIKQFYQTFEECDKAGKAKAQELMKMPNIADVFVASCLPVEAQTVSK